MAVKDFMVKRVIYVSPDTSVASAADLMKKHDFHRLPVIENDKLVGLVTEGTLAEASPSKATTLSIYEMNYLLNKMTVGQVMIKNVITVSKYASLEEATAIMLSHNIGVLPVVDSERVEGIITDKDIFKAFLEISGYGEDGVRVRILAKDEVGVLGQVVSVISQENLNISHMVNIPSKRGHEIIEVQIEGDFDISKLKAKFEDNNLIVDDIAKTETVDIK